MKLIMPNLYQFTIEYPERNCTTHQYLLLCKDPILISTGTKKQTKIILPIIKKILNKNELKYIFVSHIESNHCGGLSSFIKEYPNVTTICSSTGKKELYNYGYCGTIISKEDQDTLIGEDYLFKFISYPSEVHLKNGLLFYEEKRNIFFSIDLMSRIGCNINHILKSSWYCEINSINLKNIPNYNELEKLQNKLKKIYPKIIAVDHGYCIQCI